MQAAEIKYVIQQGVGRTSPVAPERNEEARIIDTDGDGVLTIPEVTAYMRKPCVDIWRDKVSRNDDAVYGEFVRFMEGKRPVAADTYQTYAQMAAELEELAQKYPGLAQRVQIGTSAENRPIYALKISKDIASGESANRPGVLFTGVHHSREWATGAITMQLAREILAGYGTDQQMTARVNNLEIWIVPAENPDGYTFSRTENSYWRKTRRLIYDTPCKPGENQEKPTGTGVDANRNYDLASQPEIRRPKNDSPCSTWDDSRATSDSPSNDTFRGSVGNSEPETQAILALRAQHPNLRGVIDFHSYGDLMLYPWGHKKDDVANLDEYVAVGKAMNAATSAKFKLQPCIDLYAAYGTSTDYHHATGLFAFTLEVGQSFFPSDKDLVAIVKDGLAASKVFMDHFAAKKMV